MQSSCSGVSNVTGGVLFSDKFVRQRSLPNGRAPYTASLANRSSQAASSNRKDVPSSRVTPQTVSRYTRTSHGPSATSSNGKQSKRPSSLANVSGDSKARPNISQLRQQSLPASLTKSKSSTCTAGTSAGSRSGSNSHKARHRQNMRLMSGPSLTNVHLRRGQRWQQSIPSKSSPKQPLLDKRHGVTSQRCIRCRSSVQQILSFGDSPVHTGAHRGGSGTEKTACSSEMEITQVHFDLDKLPKVESRSRRSSRVHCQCRECKDTILRPKLKRRSVEVHVPTASSSANGLKRCPANAAKCPNSVEKKQRSSSTEERGARGRKSLSHSSIYAKDGCSVRRETSKIRKTSSLSDDGEHDFDCGNSEADSLSLDFGNGLNLEESESDCVTNDTSFDYLNERGLSDEGEEAEWDEEGIPFEEELTDLDTDDDLPLSEQDLEDHLESCSSSKQPLRTCVQRELTPHHQRFNKAFLQVKGAGLTVPPERERRTSTTADEQSYSVTKGTGYSMDGENDLELVAEVERRRLRDFGPLESDSSSSPGERKCGYRTNIIHREQNDRVSGAAKAKPSIQHKNHDSSLTTGIRTCGETSALGDSSLGVSTPRGTDDPSPALTPSLFPGCLPPTIHFPMPYENYTPLSKEQRALLKWKMSSITPNVVKNCIARAGFTKCTRGSAWLGYWGRHMKASSFRTIKEHQKVNHFPGTFQIGRKDRLWRNLSRLQARVGKRDCDFVPQTFVLPQDMRQLKKQWEEGGSKQKWILKPPAAARGIGIRLAHKWNQIPKKKPVIVQRYLADPFLINGSKFDLRVYVYVSSYDPLTIYVFREGLTRFATCKYSSAMKNLSNRFMHLTNYSVNKQNSEFTPNTDETVCQGHKWGLLALWCYMRSQLGINTDQVWDSIKDLVIKTIISSEPYVSSYVKAFVKNRHSVHELFGFDIMLDRHLKPWVLEVNISPSLHSNSQLDVNIKGRMVRDLFNITGFYLPTKEQIAGEKPFVHHTLSSEERIKHSHFVQRNLPKAERKRILDSLMPDDMRMLMLFEDELSRCGHFERVYPSANSDRYRKFFEMEKYYNILLGEWAAKYEKCPRKGVLLLQRLASQSSASKPG